MQTYTSPVYLILDLLKDYYRKPENNVGGNLHIILEDPNERDKDVQFCIDRAQLRGDQDGVIIAKAILNLSITQRRKLRYHLQNYLSGKI
jgi:hypothetical protein